MDNGTTDYGISVDYLVTLVEQEHPEDILAGPQRDYRGTVRGDSEHRSTVLLNAAPS